MSRRKFYYYNFNGTRVPKSLSSMVSEFKLPEPTRVLDGKCAYSSPNIPKRFKPGSRMTVAFGDPIILYGCTMLSFSKHPAPTRFEFMNDDVLVFRYAGRRFWVDRICLSRLKDLRSAD